MSEVKVTAKSVARWTHKNFSAAGFSERQARVGALDGKVSKGGGRPSKAKEHLQAVLELKAQSCSNRDIAEDLGIGSASVSRYLKQVSE